MREIRVPNALIVCSEKVAKQFLDLLQVEDERDIYAQGMILVAYPDSAAVDEVKSLIETAKAKMG